LSPDSEENKDKTAKGKRKKEQDEECDPKARSEEYKGCVTRFRCAEPKKNGESLSQPFKCIPENECDTKKTESTGILKD